MFVNLQHDSPQLSCSGVCKSIVVQTLEPALDFQRCNVDSYSLSPLGDEIVIQVMPAEILRSVRKAWDLAGHVARGKLKEGWRGYMLRLVGELLQGQPINFFPSGTLTLADAA